jgi:hypothetical protein
MWACTGHITSLRLSYTTVSHSRPVGRPTQVLSEALGPCGQSLCHHAHLRCHSGGHAGYEIAPFIPSLEQLAWLVVAGARPSKSLNTVQHHDMHHRYPTKHFSLYFTYWDRAFHTLHPQYDAACSGCCTGKGEEGRVEEKSDAGSVSQALHAVAAEIPGKGLKQRLLATKGWSNPQNRTQFSRF